MGKLKTITIDSFYKRKVDDASDGANQGSKRVKASTSEPEQQQNQPNEHISETPRPNANELDLNILERDPAKRKHMWDYSVNERENVRRAYLNLGPFQVHLQEYPAKETNRILIMVQTHLQSKDLTIGKKVNDGKKCALLKHLGCSQHRNAIIFCENLLNQAAHIDNIIEKQSVEKVLKNRIRLKASVDIVRWLTFQTCAFRGHDETPTSKNRGNFLELLKLLVLYNDELAKIVTVSQYNSKYTSGLIQKEILCIIANRVRRHIRSEVGDSYFCVMVDEARDESKKEQMAIVLRFVDENGIIKERFLDLVHVSDTTSLTLKTSLWSTLLKYEFDTSKIRGQGYDGASNMRGEWNGLQALVAKDCPFAYYVHCFAHRLQLALVGASKEVIQVHQFFSNLTLIVNVVCASSKRHDELQKAKSIEIKRLIELGEIETGRGANQVGTLKRAGDTRWGSHYYSVCNLLKMFNSTRVVLESIIKDGSYPSQRVDADKAYTYLKSFEFVFILHLVEEIMGRTDILSQALQRKNQDIINAVELVSSTKESLNTFRNKGWDCFFKKVMLFSEKHHIEMPDMKALYKSSRYRPRGKDNHFSFEHYYRVDLFLGTLDKQIHELNNRFNDQSMELLTLGSSLVPKKDVNVLSFDEICVLVEKYYPSDFTEQERNQLKHQLDLFNNMPKNSKLSGISSITELCARLFETKKNEPFFLLDRLIRLILTFPVSTTTTERGFSAMKIFKNRLRNKMSDEFLASNLVVYIEKEISENFDSESVIDEFKSPKGRRAKL